MEAIEIKLSAGSMIALNIIIAVMMLGVSLDLKPNDFYRIIKNPKAPTVGLMAQFVMLPALTCLAIWMLPIEPTLGLGMMLVAACPGGSFSNIMTWLAKGNVAVSVSMTAVSSLAAIILTPFNFSFYAWLNPKTRSLLTEINIDAFELLILVVLVLAIPLIIGMCLGKYYPKLIKKIEKPLQIFSLVCLFSIVTMAFAQNFSYFLKYFHLFFWLVVGHNALALMIGYVMARITGLPVADKRAITLEVGIQNSALGIAIILTFFPQATGMLLIAAFWGTWHLVSGLSLSLFWSKQKIED